MIKWRENGGYWSGRVDERSEKSVRITDSSRHHAEQAWLSLRPLNFDIFGSLDKDETAGSFIISF